MYPSLEEVKKIAVSGEYRRIPVCRELYADRYTPVEVLRTLRGSSRHCYLLESASQTESWGRYSFLGCHPTLEPTRSTTCWVRCCWRKRWARPASSPRPAQASTV